MFLILPRNISIEFFSLHFFSSYSHIHQIFIGYFIYRYFKRYYNVIAIVYNLQLVHMGAVLRRHKNCIFDTDTDTGHAQAYKHMCMCIFLTHTRMETINIYRRQRCVRWLRYPFPTGFGFYYIIRSQCNRNVSGSSMEKRLHLQLAAAWSPRREITALTRPQWWRTAAIGDTYMSHCDLSSR